MFDRCYLKVFIFLTFCHLFALYAFEESCALKSLCSCEFQNKTIIDLSSLAFRNGTPRFANVQPTISTVDNYTYSYNPCYPFTQGGGQGPCSNVAVCQIKGNNEQFYNLGKQASANFYMNNSQLIMNYTGVEETTNRRTSVYLVCDPSRDELVVDGEYSPQNYRMTLYSRCACPNGCQAAANPDDGLSTGSVLVILLFVFVLCYLLGGIIFQKIMKGARGRELLPNYEFWMDFPLLVRDGVIFTCNGCQNEVSYERI